jgi:nucleoside-diphosphate-sugar epimerase
LTTGAVRLQSDGTAWRPLIHVQDMALAMVAALAAPREKIHGEAFNAGASGANYVVRELALIVADTVGDVEVEFAEGAGADPRSYRVDFSKIAETLDGFEPAWDAPRGAQQLVDAYRDAGMDAAMFSGDRFIRLSRLKTLIDAGRLDDELRWRAEAGVPVRL